MSVRTSGGVYNRRALALARLESQLKLGLKQLSHKKIKELGINASETMIPLNEGDIKRIQKEITSLQGDKAKRKRKGDKVKK